MCKWITCWGVLLTAAGCSLGASTLSHEVATPWLRSSSQPVEVRISIALVETSGGSGSKFSLSTWNMPVAVLEMRRVGGSTSPDIVGGLGRTEVDKPRRRTALPRIAEQLLERSELRWSPEGFFVAARADGGLWRVAHVDPPTAVRKVLSHAAPCGGSGSEPDFRGCMLWMHFEYRPEDSNWLTHFENTALTHPAVARAVAVGVPPLAVGQWGDSVYESESPAVFLVLKPRARATQSELKEFLMHALHTDRPANTRRAPTVPAVFIRHDLATEPSDAERFRLMNDAYRELFAVGGEWDPARFGIARASDDSHRNR